MYVWVNFWALCFIPLIYVSFYMQIPYCFSYFSFVIQFEIRECDTSSFVILKITLAIWGLLCFHTHFKIFYPISVKNAIGILIGVGLNLYIIGSGSMDILTILILSIHEHGISFHLFVPCSISFINVLWFSV